MTLIHATMFSENYTTKQKDEILKLFSFTTALLSNYYCYFFVGSVRPVVLCVIYIFLITDVFMVFLSF